MATVQPEGGQDEMFLTVLLDFMRQQDLHSSSSGQRGHRMIWAVAMTLLSTFLSAAVQLAYQTHTIRQNAL